MNVFIPFLNTVKDIMPFKKRESNSDILSYGYFACNIYPTKSQIFLDHSGKKQLLTNLFLLHIQQICRQTDFLNKFSFFLQDMYLGTTEKICQLNSSDHRSNYILKVCLKAFYGLGVHSHATEVLNL